MNNSRNPTVKIEYVQLWLSVKLRVLGKNGLGNASRVQQLTRKAFFCNKIILVKSFNIELSIELWLATQRTSIQEVKGDQTFETMS